MNSSAIADNCGPPRALILGEPNAFVSGAIYSFSGILRVLSNGCGSEICFSIVQTIAIDVVEDESCRDREDLAVHQDTRVLAAGQAHRALCIKNIFSFRLADAPFVLSQSWIIIRVNDSIFALCERDFAKGIAEPQAPIE